ncbi:MAG: hypothetical protein U0Q18_26200 [Bryobacteraceae bacterium]
MRRMTPIAPVHLVGNALLMGLGYYWLGLGETRAATLLWSLLVALAVLALTCWLEGATFVYFGPNVGSIKGAFAATLRRVGPLAAIAILLLVLYGLLARWDAYSGQPAFRIASYLTVKLRKPVKPSGVLAAFRVVLWIVRWMIIPVLVLPLCAAVAQRSKVRPRTRLYWIATPVLLTLALWVSVKLIGWTPHVGGFAMETTSFVLRLAVAYLLFVAAWLLLAFLTSGGKPALTQPKTVASP